MKIAALYDIHGNLPALEAVIEDVRHAGANQIVVGGDVVPGPMPCESLELLLGLDLPVHFIHGNCELAALAQMAAARPEDVTYWGTTSGEPLPEQYLAPFRWCAEQVRARYQDVLACWPKTLTVAVDGLGEVLFCHSTPRSETEIFTRLTPEERLLPIFGGIGVSTVICGHTHMQFDRMVGSTRVVNAGSVGSPFGKPGAYWALLGSDVQLRRTEYDLQEAARRIRATGYPRADEDARDLLAPASEEQMLSLYSTAELK